MLQFFKKTGRNKRDGDLSNDCSRSQHKQQQQQQTHDDDILLAAEKYCENKRNYDSSELQCGFSKNILQIVTNKNCLSYFIQFLDLKNALHLIKFWLDADSFRTAAKQCNLHQTTSLDLILNQFEKGCELDDCVGYQYNEQIDEYKKTLLSKSISLDTFNAKKATNYFDQYDCESISSNSLCENSFEEVEEQNVNTQNEEAKSNNKINKNCIVATDGYQENANCCITEICDMGRPLTDDEKSQLCEKKQKNEKTKTESLASSSVGSSISTERKNSFKSSVASDAIRIYKKYLTIKSQHYIDVPATILSTLSLELCNDKTDNTHQRAIADLFVEAQTFVLEHLERLYLTPFIESSFYCKYCVDILTGNNLKIQDILYCESALFFFMEFLEQENKRHYLDFWMTAVNFKKLLKNADQANCNNNNNEFSQAQGDALVIYEKYFSLQATSPLNISDMVRCRIEENICSDKISHSCFDYPLIIIERYLEQKYFKSFVTSHLFYKYLSELLHKIDGNPNDETTASVQFHGAGETNEIIVKKISRHRKTFSDCSNEKTIHFKNNISAQNTLLAMESHSTSRGMTNKKSKFKSSASTADMHIDSKLLYNPELLWRRNSISGLSFGRVDALGRYERDFDMGPVQAAGNTDHSNRTTKSSKFKQAVRKLVNLPEDRVQEEIAWQMAEMIVKDITNVTLK